MDEEASLPANSEATPTQSGDLPARNIPGLDGLRAISVLFVLLRHEVYAPIAKLPEDIFRNAALGVTMFFVISGFLITHLMLSEIHSAGRLNLKNFYVRRAFRIFPAFYFYLFVVVVLSQVFHLFSADGSRLIGAATYTLNYMPRTSVGWEVGQAWSLCVEEHFYLLWPLILSRFSKRTCSRIAGSIVVLSPLIRVLTYLVDRRSLGSIAYMTHTRLDGLMVGAFIALSLHRQVYRRFLSVLRSGATALMAVASILLVEPKVGATFLHAFGFTWDAIGCGSILLYAIHGHRYPIGKFLDNAVLRHIGIVSYSLYLWQQLFEGPFTRLPPWNLLAVFACAEASYWFLERPALRLRQRLFPSDSRSRQPKDPELANEVRSA